MNHDLIQQLGISAALIDRVTAREQREIERREQLYREGRPALSASQRRVVLMDDGLATGSTMMAAERALRLQQPKQIIVAVPVAAPQACEEFQGHVDRVICAATPEPFHAVGIWYEDFTQTSDAEVRELLERAAREHVT